MSALCPRTPRPFSSRSGTTRPPLAPGLPGHRAPLGSWDRLRERWRRAPERAAEGSGFPRAVTHPAIRAAGRGNAVARTAPGRRSAGARPTLRLLGLAQRLRPLPRAQEPRASPPTRDSGRLSAGPSDLVGRAGAAGRRRAGCPAPRSALTASPACQHGAGEEPPTAAAPGDPLQTCCRPSWPSRPALPGGGSRQETQSRPTAGLQSTVQAGARPPRDLCSPATPSRCAPALRAATDGHVAAVPLGGPARPGRGRSSRTGVPAADHRHPRPLCSRAFPSLAARLRSPRA